MQKVLIVLTQFCRKNESTPKSNGQKADSSNRKRKVFLEDKENSNIGK
jgi:hypothetical protein